MGRLLKAQAVIGGVILLVTIAAVAGASSAGTCQASGVGPVGGVPAQLIPLYQAAAAKYGLGPQGPAVLAAINDVESKFGQNLSTSSAGAVGWIDGRGDGEFAVALRCGLLWEDGARLYAGVGVMPDSDPARELDETELKFKALLTALV